MTVVSSGVSESPTTPDETAALVRLAEASIRLHVQPERQWGEDDLRRWRRYLDSDGGLTAEATDWVAAYDALLAIRAPSEPPERTGE